MRTVNMRLKKRTKNDFAMSRHRGEMIMDGDLEDGLSISSDESIQKNSEVAKNPQDF